MMLLRVSAVEIIMVHANDPRLLTIASSYVGTGCEMPRHFSSSSTHELAWAWLRQLLVVPSLVSLVR